jgi:MATE family multidrug resistance protein
VFTVLVGGMGILMSLDPIVAQALGAGDREAAARGVQRGMLLAVLLSVPVSLLLVPVRFVLTLFHQPADVVPSASAYVLVSIPGVFPFLAFVVLRQSLQAMHRTRPIVAAIVGANLCNLLLNWILIFGHLGAPALGAVGSAWATSLSRWVMAFLLLLAGREDLGSFLSPLRPGVLETQPLLRMLRLGYPIGLQYQLELGAFATIGLLMGYLGTREVAAHQIALNLASLTFMVPLGVSAAAAVRVGHAVGRGDAAGAKRSARVAVGLGAAFMGATGILLVVAPRILARVYTSEPSVVAVAVALIPIAGFFQVFDGLQVVSAGVLRGLGDTRVPMAINVLGFWLIGMPVSLYLAFRAQAGPEGLWWGLVVGLASVALLLLARVVVRLQAGVSRVRIERDYSPPHDAA